MNEKILITIIISAYNVSEWIERCVKSVQAQTYQDLQIIVIDDGSTDGTGKLIDDLATQDERIMTVHQKNSGLIMVREKGIALAEGEYVGFVDGDDEVEPNMYMRLLNNAIKYGADISHCGIMYCFYDGRTKAMHGTEKVTVMNRVEGCQELLKGQLFEPSLCSKLYKRELLVDSCLDYSVINNEDLLRNIVLFSRCNKSVIDDFCGYRYWRRTNSMSNNRNVIKIGNNLMKARKLILENSIPEVKDEAFALYANAAISIYSRLIGHSEEGAEELRNCCLAVLKDNQKQTMKLEHRMCMRASAILYFPALYQFMYKAYRSYRRRQIRKEVEELKKD